MQARHFASYVERVTRFNLLLWFPRQEPLNSGDDVSDEEDQELFDTENVVVCQYDKVRNDLLCERMQHSTTQSSSTGILQSYSVRVFSFGY